MEGDNATCDRDEIARKLQEDLLLVEYKQADEAKTELSEFLSSYKEFKASKDFFCYANGKTQQFTKVQGAISVKQKDGAYEVLLVLWLPIHFPLKGPMVEVRPINKGQTIKTIEEFVSSKGQVTHIYLKQWKHPGSSLGDFVEILAEEFIAKPPLYNTALSFYHVPEDRYQQRIIQARPVTELITGGSRHGSIESEYVLSDELEQFAQDNDLPEDMKWLLGRHGFQTTKLIRCIEESDIDKMKMSLAESAQLREAIKKLKGGNTSAGPSDLAKLYENLGKVAYKNLEQITVDADDLEIIGRLGEGNFGVVYKGKLRKRGEECKMVDVAVKTLQERATQRHLEDFLQEVINMRPLDHHNVMCMLGFVYKAGRPYIIMPFMAKGDLLDYVSQPDKEFMVSDMLALGLQVATGMLYLAEEKFVHGDLAARNCMIAEDNTVKVGDFGLARHLFLSEYYRSSGDKPCPTRWMAPEVLLKSTYTLKSDVWSFGVVLWELFTRGKTPYEGTIPVLVDGLIARGYRLGRPKSANKAIFRVMTDCWKADQADRPNFVDLRHWLSTLGGDDVYRTERVVMSTEHLEPVPPKLKPVTRKTSLLPDS